MITLRNQTSLHCTLANLCSSMLSQTKSHYKSPLPLKMYKCQICSWQFSEVSWASPPLVIPFMAAVRPPMLTLDETSPQVLQGSFFFPLRSCYAIFNILFLIAFPAEGQIMILKPCLPIHLNFPRVIMCPLPSGINHCCVPYFNILRSHITQHTLNIYIWCKDCRMAFYIKARRFRDSDRSEMPKLRQMNKAEPEKGYSGSESHHRRPQV